MKKLFFLACLMMAVIVANATTYELKHPWGGGEWNWKTLAAADDGTYYVNARYGGSGCNWRADGGSESWVANPTTTAGMVTGDSARFSFDPTTNTITITLLEEGSREVHYYIKHPWNGGSWDWKQMTEVSDGVWVLRDIYGNNGCNVNTVNADGGAAWFATGDITLSGNPAKGDSAIFTYTVAGATLSIEKIASAADTTPVVVPEPLPGVQYYVHGWINNADYAGYDIPFVDGVAAMPSTSADSYCYIYDATYNVNFMTDGWQGSVTSVVLYNATTVAEGNKLQVPAGTANLYMAVNTDGSLTLSLSPIQPADTTTTEPTDPITPGGDDEEDPTAERYYVFGYINGADYNEYDFPFVDGVATLSGITAESYVFVHAYNSGEEYFTNGWTDGASTVTLVNGKTLTSGHDKMLVPASTTKLYLKVNADDTMILSLSPIQTALSENQAAATVQKILENGVVYIIRDGVRYNVLGAVVK